MVTRTTRLKDFKTDGYPVSELPVQALAEDHVGTYVLPFPCQHINGEWQNATTGEAVQTTILGWREVQTRSRASTSPDQQPTKA
ncbi:hypothetical protein J4G37_26715 [Microvirga sp. 3-52]|jgi:hypothetical protein|nr:hypothetical protein [Microvirga sp. 3-52]